jgi:hypothetical protein
MGSKTGSRKDRESARRSDELLEHNDRPSVQHDQFAALELTVQFVPESLHGRARELETLGAPANALVWVGVVIDLEGIQVHFPRAPAPAWWNGGRGTSQYLPLHAVDDVDRTNA